MSREPPAPARCRARFSAHLWLSFGPSMTVKQRPLREPVTTAGACLRPRGCDPEHAVRAAPQMPGRRGHAGNVGQVPQRRTSERRVPELPDPGGQQRNVCVHRGGRPRQRGGGGPLCPASSQLSGHCWAGPAAQKGLGARGPGHGGTSLQREGSRRDAEHTLPASNTSRVHSARKSKRKFSPTVLSDLDPSLPGARVLHVSARVYKDTRVPAGTQALAQTPLEVDKYFKTRVLRTLILQGQLSCAELAIGSTVVARKIGHFDPAS